MKKLIIFLAFFSLSYASTVSLEKVFSKEQQTFFLAFLQKQKQKIYNQAEYQLQIGWNRLLTPKDGINIKETFNDSSVLYVVVFDEVSKKWALYSPLMQDTKEYLDLFYIEPYHNFFVYMKEKKSLPIKSNYINMACKRELKKNSYLSLLDSGISKKAVIAKDASISISSRYYSHHEKGIYNDTRVMLIYPKLVDIQTKSIYQYGPAQPTVLLKFAKEYEGRKFFIYDFKDKTCYKGYFPSHKIPPFPILQIYK